MNQLLTLFAMRFRYSLSATILVTWLSLCGGAADAALPAPPTFASNYRLKFGQDFTTMTSLAVTANTLAAGHLWIAHKPGGGDWFVFADPVSDYNPFHVGGGDLVIRVAKRTYTPNQTWFSGYSGGLLSSMDGTGTGFAQQYGYFECSMWSPGSPNTWPAFWLLDKPSLTTATPYAAEIDITESYGNWGTGPNQIPAGDPNMSVMSWHNWGHNGNPHTTASHAISRPGMTTGYHTYGVDIGPTYTTWYFDRVQVWQQPTLAAAKVPMFVMVNLALGGGNYNNSTGTGYNWSLTPNPTDLRVKYIAVWASPNSPNYNFVPPVPTDLTAISGSDQIMLKWKMSSGATSYNIYRGTTAGGQNATPIATGITNPSYTNNGLASGTTYYYKVAGVNSVGTSAKSNEASATTALAPIIAVEAESRSVSASSGDPHSVTYDSRFSNGAGTLFSSNAVNDYVTYPILIPETRNYNLRIGIKKYSNRGIFQLAASQTLTGTYYNQGSPQDLYATGEIFTELNIGTVSHTAGTRYYRFKVTGKNASSTGYVLLLDYIKLTPQ